MRYRLNKIVVAILLALSISIPIIAIKASAEDADTTKIDSCEKVWKEYDATTVAGYLAKENDYPTYDKHLFAGWYTDKVCDSAHALKGKTPTGTTYALFVPEHVLSVKAQVSPHLIDGKITEEDAAASIRFVTTVDSLHYKKVGFEVTYKGTDGTQKESFSETNTVYERLYVTDSDQKWPKTPYGSFCGVSQFFRAHTINGVPRSYYDTVFTVKPYWITLDGDKVYGVQDTKTIAQGAKVDITINNDGTNGTVSADKDWYLPGETVTLTGKGNSGYRCIGMNVNGTDYELDANGTYSFVTEQGKTYTVSGIYEKVFALDGNSHAWDLEHLDEGIVTRLKRDQLYALKLAKDYTNIDLTVTARDYDDESESVARTDIYFKFTNGAYISFSASIVNDGGEHDGKLELTTINRGLYTNDDAKAIYPKWNAWGYLSEEMTTQYIEAGLDIRVVRCGTEIYLLAGEDMELITVADLANNPNYQVTADMAATIEIRHWGDEGVQVEIPFKLTEEVDITTLSFDESPYGTVTPNRTEYVMGTTIELRGKGISAYRCTGLIINGEKVSLEPGESYKLKATESNYTISGCFERVFENHDTWDLTRLDDGVISLPVNGTKGQYAEGWLDLYGKFTDIDITVWARDYDVNTKDDRTDILFVFENGAHVSFGLCTFSDGTVGISVFNKENSSTDTRHIYAPGAWDGNGRVDSQARDLYQGDGVKFRVQRVGTEIYLYVNDVQHSKVADLTNNTSYPVTADMKANVYIRRWGDYNSEVEIPFLISAAPDKELFYTNSKKTDIADPFILDNTEVDGYYYMYGTPATTTCYRSTNLMDWTSMGVSPIDKTKASTEAQNALASDDWAPEVVYDADTETYYMFFSATPAKVSGELSGNAYGLLMVATSKSPYKDFTLVDFTDAESCGEGNVHDPDSSYPQYYAKYALFEPNQQRQFCNKDKTYTGNYGGHYPAIDPHPYEDETGKYLFWVDQDGDDRICVVKMVNWLQPDWSTATVLTGGGYYTPEDYAFVQKYGTFIGSIYGVDEVPYDKIGGTGHYVNEAPEVVKHNGKYYLTYSTGLYSDRTYQVIQAVSTTESIMGPYRKLNEDEGAILLSAIATGSNEVTGTGHHSFVTAGDKLYMVYHRHNSSAMGGARNHAIDEVKWITIKDKDGNDLDVMYANGPTSTLQPKIDAYSEYVNIAEDKERVTVSANTTADNLSCLTDGYLSVHKNMNTTFINNVKETTISETTTFTFDFDSARAVRGIMVYNSKTRSTCFMNISQIKLVCEENGVETTQIIENVQFSSDYYTSDYVKPGTAAYAEFDEMNVKSIEITIDVPEGQDSVGISEVRILGK